MSVVLSDQRRGNAAVLADRLNVEALPRPPPLALQRAQGNRSDLTSVGLPPKSLRDWERRLNLELKASIEVQRIEKLPEDEPKR